jgi:hypothetical protein
LNYISDLGRASDLWEYWGFSLWDAPGMKGVYRRVTFVKNALIGEVCRYYADDYIIWNHSGKEDKERILKTCRPQTDLMTQRYLFVEASESREKGRVRSFLFGLRGYAEVHSFTPGGQYEKRIKDLAPLVDKALELVRSRKDDTGGGA